MVPARQLLCLCLWLFHVLTQCWGLPDPVVLIHLRTHTIDIAHAASRNATSVLRRSALEQEPHTHSEQWGALRGASQLILTHRPDLGHAERVDLIRQLNRRGLEVAGYIPDSSLLVVGPGHLADELEALPGVLWVGHHMPSYKVAPEWEGILEQLRLVPSNISWGLERDAAQRAAAAVLSALPCTVEFSRSTGQPRVGIQVAMPSMLDGQGSGWQRSGRLLQRVEQHAGAAAAADWVAPLNSLCSDAVEVRPGGRSAALVFAPPRCLEAVLDWLASRPAVHWVTPFPRIKLAANHASSISQSGQPGRSLWRPSDNTDASLHPLWAAGITGANQIIACGDSGVDRRHCFFKDPSIDDATWRSKVSFVAGVKTFDCPECRKIRYYRADGDESDSNGHGTHVAGTLLGFPYSASSLTSPGTQFIGMAPSARLAFVDLGDGTSDSIFTPGDLDRGYFEFTTAVGAFIHSNSWGSSTLNYDYLSMQVDQYCWRNKDFLPVFAAGNEGDMLTRRGESGVTTVTSPGTAKNCICVGATQSADEGLATSAVKYITYDATVTEGNNYESKFKVLQAAFGASISSLGSKGYPVVTASPLLACGSLQNSADVKGAVVLIQRGICNFEQKAAFAQQAGAAAALIFDDKMGAYFVLGDDSGVTVHIPTMSITRRLGQQLFDSLSIGKAISISFAPSSPPANSFENLAAYSSQGPTIDNRIKPDLVAPGTIRSARVLTSVASDECGTVRMAGTSMATPVVAGSAALVRQYFMDGYYPSGKKNQDDAFTPSSALIKAVMISGASSIQGVEADTGLPIDPPPSFRQGFGRINLGQSVFLEGSRTKLQVVDRVEINTGDSHEYCIRANGGPMTITLVWTDYPGSPIAAKALVNDLDLTVRAEGFNGMPLFGNGGSVTDSSIPDRENNVEQVNLEGLPEGRVSIEVKAFSIYAAGGPQPYSLVVTGDFQGELTRTGTDGSGDCAILVAVIKSGPTGVTNQDIRFEFGTQTGNSRGVSFECQLADPEGNVTAPGQFVWQDCSSPLTLDGLPDGPYQFSVRAKGEKIASSQSFIKDTAPPTMSFASTPAATTPEDTAILAFSAGDASPVTFTCRLVNTSSSSLQGAVYSGTIKSAPMKLSQAYNCTSPQTFHWLLPGQWRFEVVGTDAAGNAAPALAYSWSVAFDAGKQYTRLNKGLFRLVPKLPAQFEFRVLQASGSSVAAVPNAATVCWLEAVSAGGAASDWQACTSPKSYGLLSDGTYRFHARAAAAASAADTDAVSEFTIDSTAPVAVITSSPSAIHSSKTVEIQFDSNEEGSTFRCRMVNEDDSSVGNTAFESCVSPKQYANLTDGLYDFSVKGTDRVGNEGLPTNTSFVIDTTPPTFTSINYPRGSNKPDITVTFEVNDGKRSQVQNTTCRFRTVSLVSGTPAEASWSSCSSPLEYKGLAEGHYGLTIRATDPAGLVNQTKELDIWVDFTAPDKINFTSAPPKSGKVGSTVTFVLDENTGALQPRTASPIDTYTTLLQTVSQDQYTGILNGSITSLTTSTGGGTAPSAGPGQAVLQSLNSSSSSNDGNGAAAGSQAVLLEDDSAAANGTTLDKGVLGVQTNASSPLIYKGLDSGYYALQVRAVDAAGNVGADQAPWPFQVDASLDSTGGLSTTIWIIIGVAGGTALLVVFLIFICWMRKRKSSQQPTGAITTVSQRPQANGHSNGHINGYANGYANGYGNGYSGAYQNGAAGAWGYSNPALASDPIYQQQLALQAAAQRHSSSRPAPATPARPPPPPPAAPPAASADVLYEQQLAYALAASQRETSGRRRDSEDELHRAIQASLQEQRGSGVRPPPYPAATGEEDDPELRAAIQASLQERQRQEQLAPWGGSPTHRQGGGGGGNWASLL